MIMIVYAILFAISVFGICFVLFRKRKVVYTYPATNQVKNKQKKYRYNSDVHVYHQDVLGEYSGDLYMDKEMTQRFSRRIKMPMHELVVYVPMDSEIEETRNSQKEDVVPVN